MEDDPISNDSANPAFAQLLRSAAGKGRRRVLQLGLGCAALACFGLPALAGQSGNRRSPGMGFAAIGASREDRVRVPDGYTLQLLYAWGDPISDGPAFRTDASNSAGEQAEQAGMHHDGMHFFPWREDGKPSSSHGLLCINHEYTDDGLLHPGGMADWSHDKTRKAQNAHGVSVIEVRLVAVGDAELCWQLVRPSPYARRITARTPIRIAGPAAGAPSMRTRDDRRGDVVFGTLANCAMGHTPWGTYLSCEENFDAYFNGLAEPTAAQKRYRLRANGAGFRWHEHDRRFDVASEPNEANRFGWVVEIDPWQPARPPVKRTALGRLKHECATVTAASDGRVVVYMSDDEAFEYLYKYVSRDAYDPGDPAAGDRLLDIGTLYVACFDADGKGRWRALQHGQNGLDAAGGFVDQADILIRTRQAADLLGATRMDRPEWLAVDPHSGEVYCSLTNNRQRTSAEAANPRTANVFGHIIRWREDGADAAAAAFSWDVFVLCGDPASSDPGKRGNIKGDAFGSPDGLWFDAAGRLWIQTDVSGSVINRGDHERLGNNQMLVADIASGEIRRFLTGPRGGEISGISSTPDSRSLFVNVQHPGEVAGARSQPAAALAGSQWPANQFAGVTGGRPRSATVVIRRQDGGVVGG